MLWQWAVPCFSEASEGTKARLHSGPKHKQSELLH